MDVDTIRALVKDGLISWIKYAIVRPDTAHDEFLRQLVDAIGAETIVSGIGEQPATIHLQDFGLSGFTSGCVCVAPRRSMAMLRALQEDNVERAEQIRKTFQPLENLRDTLSPVRVLHHAVHLAGIAKTGPLTPPLASIDENNLAAIEAAAKNLIDE